MVSQQRIVAFLSLEGLFLITIPSTNFVETCENLLLDYAIIGSLGRSNLARWPSRLPLRNQINNSLRGLPSRLAPGSPACWSAIASQPDA
jgi:hypothetical protein